MQTEIQKKPNGIDQQLFLSTMLIPDCITDEIIEYHNFANKLIFTDYNLNNHKKNYVQKEVVFETMETIEYNSATTFCSIGAEIQRFCSKLSW